MVYGYIVLGAGCKWYIRGPRVVRYEWCVVCTIHLVHYSVHGAWFVSYIVVFSDLPSVSSTLCLVQQARTTSRRIYTWPGIGNIIIVLFTHYYINASYIFVHSGIYSLLYPDTAVTTGVAGFFFNHFFVSYRCCCLCINRLLKRGIRWIMSV